MSDSVQASSGQTIVPPAPVAPDGHTHEAACLNCGTALIGAHCHACGQEAHLHRTAGAFLHDLLHGALHFEGRTGATLPMLVRRPGQLTRRYIEGERTKFVSPMGLFLFTVFIMFAVFQIAGIGPPADLALSNETQASVTELQIRARGDRADIARQLAEVPDDDPTRAALQDRLAELDAAINVLGRAQSNADPAEQLENIHTGWTRLDHGIEKARKNPGLALYKLQSNSYKFSWLLIPLSLPFVALLFAWRRRFGLYDHAVFVTYSLSFMSLLFVALTILGFAGVPLTWLLLAGTVLPIWHMATQLRHAYGLSRGSALWRTVVLTFFIQVIVSLFVTVLLVLGLMG